LNDGSPGTLSDLVDQFREEHRGTDDTGAAGSRDVARGPLWSRLHRSDSVAATLRAECWSDRAGAALRTGFGPTQQGGAAQAPPATRAERRSEANAGNSRHASRRRRKSVRRPALGRVDSRSGRAPELARRRDQEARRRTRPQAGDVRLAWSGRGRRCGGSGKAPPWLPFFRARRRDEGRVRSSGDVAGGYHGGSSR
jgi:hypothetical protein